MSEDVRIEWGLKWTGDDGTPEYEECTSERQARFLAGQYPSARVVCSEVRRGAWTEA